MHFLFYMDILTSIRLQDENESGHVLCLCFRDWQYGSCDTLFMVNFKRLSKFVSFQSNDSEKLYTLQSPKISIILKIIFFFNDVACAIMQNRIRVSGKLPKSDLH